MFNQMGKNLHHIHPNNQNDDENMGKNNVSVSNSLNSEISAIKSNQISVQGSQEEYPYVTKAILFAAFLDMVMQGNKRIVIHVETQQNEAENQQILIQGSHLECPKVHILSKMKESDANIFHLDFEQASNQIFNAENNYASDSISD